MLPSLPPTLWLLIPTSAPASHHWSYHRTLGGAWVQRRGDHLLIGRDPGEARRAWSDGIWDGRYQRPKTDERAEASEATKLPFLVRDSAPVEAAEEIISDRLAQWSQALRLSAQFGAAMVQDV